MSNNTNTQLLEDAAFYIDYWVGTVMQGILEADLAREDYDSLYEHVEEARRMAYEREFKPENSLTGFNDVF